MSTQPKIEIQSAPLAKGVLTDEERKKRFQELRQRQGRSMLHTEGPPGKTGYWARKNDSAELSRLEYVGFSIVKDDPKHPSWKATGLQEDGTYVVGDVILMEIDSVLYQMLLDDDAKRCRDMIPSASSNFQVEAAKQDVPTFETSGKGVRK